ncbi:MAG: HEAT repeat domain-containing protein [Kiritimatiellae bacterium]|nr:HEAT repeat domain-containing protein [Kiritimatiellia bacterium]
MSATLRQLLEVRSAVARDTSSYLRDLAARAAELPKYFPAHLRSPDASVTPFDTVRQMVQVVEDRSAFERWMAEERERTRAAGIDLDRVAYKPARARVELGEERDVDPERHECPPPIPWDEHAARRWHRAVILGDPGFGKTWLLRFEARRLARQALRQLEDRSVSLEDLDLPIHVRLSDLNQWLPDHPESVRDFVRGLIGHGRSERFIEFVGQKLAGERCVLLLDAWDEVPVEVPERGQQIARKPHLRQWLSDVLKALSEICPKPRILLTSRIVGYGESPIPGIQELELLAWDQPQIEAFVGTWFGEGADAAREFLAMLQTNHQVQGLSRIPLMLTLMCRAWQEGGGHTRTAGEADAKAGHDFPSRRVELYERCLRGLLRDWKREDKQQEGVQVSDGWVDAVLEMLGSVSFVLFKEGYEQFSESVLRTKMVPVLESLRPTHELHGRDAASLIADLKRDGVLITAGESANAPLLFLHRTFQEYLSASELARQANKEGWAAISRLIDKKAWLPAWEQVVVLLAGMLVEPAPLLEMLRNPAPTPTNPTGDDVHRGRLALAARCIPELPPRRRTYCGDLVDRVTAEICTFLLTHHIPRPWRTCAHLCLALPAIAQVNGRIRGLPCLTFLAQRLVNGQADRDLISTLVLVQLMGRAAATPPILDALRALLRRGDSVVRNRVAYLLGFLGSAAATPPVVESLAILVYDSDLHVSELALWALWRMGSAAATPWVIRKLLALLSVPDIAPGIVRSRAAEVLGGLGSSAATPWVLHRLLGLLAVPDDGVRSQAAEVLGGLGSAAATPPVIEGLVMLLRDPHAGVSVCWSVAEALGRLGSTAATPQVIQELLALLRDSEGGVEVRSRAAEALGQLGSTAATPQVIQGLLALLRDSEAGVEVRSQVAEALGRLGSAAATAQAIETLMALLPEKDTMHLGAARALGRLGSAAATPLVLQALLELLRGPGCPKCCKEAKQVLVGLGSAAATPAVLESLLALLRNADGAVRARAAAVLGELGNAVATPRVIEGLVMLLRDPDAGGSVRSRAAEALGRLGSAAATPRVIEGLGMLLRDRDAGGSVRSRAAEALGRLGSAAAMPRVIEGLVALLQDPRSGPSVRYRVVRALADLGGAAATPLVLDALLALLPEKDSIHLGAARALGRLGSAVATPSVLATLLALLRGPGCSLCCLEAEEALAGFASAAAKSAVLERLFMLFHNDDEAVRSRAAKLAARLGSAAATPWGIQRLVALLHDETARGCAAYVLDSLVGKGLRIFRDNGLYSRTVYELSSY